MKTVIAMATGILLGFWSGPTAAQEHRAASREGEDLIRWIGDACPVAPDLVALMRLDQVAGKAVNDWLRTGRYRDAHALAVRYLDCLKGPGLAEYLEVARSRVAMLEQVLCFLPLVIFEVEQTLDADLAARSLTRCPRPPENAPPDHTAWAESVRRYLHLLAAVRPAEEVLDASLSFLKALRDAGFSFPGTSVPQGPSAAPFTGESGEGSEQPPTETPTGEENPAQELAGQGPDPVFAVMVLGIAAAVATGDLDGLVHMIGAGNDEEACSSSFLAAVGVMMVLPMPRRAALPIIQTNLVSRTPIERRLNVVRAAIERFGATARGGKPCVVLQTVAAMVLASLDTDTFDRAVADGRVEDLARVVGTISVPVSLPGSPAARAEVLRVVAERAEGDEDRVRWLCPLGDAYLEARRNDLAVSAFDSAAAIEKGAGRACGSSGRLRALIADPQATFDQVVSAAHVFLETGPDAPSVFAIVAGAPDPGAKATAIRALCAAGRGRDQGGKPRGLAEAVMEALIKVVDTDPGSEAARIALDAVVQSGGPDRPSDRVIWGLVSSRHYVMTHQESEAIRALKQAFSGAGPEVEGVKEGTAALLRWLAAGDHVRVLDRAVDLARTARVVEAPVLAQVGAIRGERGDRGRARALLRSAVLARPSATEDWLMIADAYARIDEPTLASAALDKAGPESSWDRRHFMIRGRIEMDRRRYREAAAAYTKASDLSRGDCEPLFFRGLVRLLLGDAEGAVQDFEQCRTLGEDSAQVLGGLAYAHFDQSSWDEAESVFREALAKDEKSADNHMGLALTLFRQGRLDEARRSYERAVELEPAMKKGYAEAEKKGYVYSAIEKKAWTELVRAIHAKGRPR